MELGRHVSILASSIAIVKPCAALIPDALCVTCFICFSFLEALSFSLLTPYSKIPDDMALFENCKDYFCWTTSSFYLKVTSFNYGK